MTTLDERDGFDCDGTATAPPGAHVTAHRSSPSKTVFTETNNSDGWIATDCTVSLER